MLVACGRGQADLDPYEWLPGGDTTNTVLLGPNAFLRPAANLTDEHEQDFYSGNSFFNQAWVEAPASTDARDGLGPLFNARSCSGCHFRDGRASPPEDGQAPFIGLLLRISVPGADRPVPDPVYGEQLQDIGVEGVPPEASPSVQWEEVDGLLHPTYTLAEPAWGPLSEDLMVSPRVAPHMVGLGLLEAVPEERLYELADPDDSDGDGISGRIQMDEEGRIGRFGWKAEAATIEAQAAGAFSGDMGLTSRVIPTDDCTIEQPECLEQTTGGEPEVTDDIFDLVVLYSRAVAVPVRRQADDGEVLRGKQVFHDIGCASCHTPSHTTGAAALPEFEDQLIWPYTDLLLHDMGPGLADERPVGEASGQEWRTPPLWGVGLFDEVNGHTRYLHDGRARSIEEAILWHDGEAGDSREAYQALEVDDQQSLITFVEDL